MAPRKVAQPRRTAAYYRKNSAARKKKAAYDTAYHSTPARKKYRRDLQKTRRARGVAGKGGNDMSHTRSGKIVSENPSKNRARKGKK